MRAFLEFFGLREAIATLLLMGLLHFVGGKMSSEVEGPRRWARGLAAVAFLLYGALGIATFDPRSPSEFLTIGVQAVLAMGTIRGLALATLPILHYVYRHSWAIPEERRRTAEQERSRRAEERHRANVAAQAASDAAARQAEEQRRRDAEAATRPPPPTREQRLAEAKARYEAAIATLDKAGLDENELRGARDRAKQQYLKEIDQVI
jgi:hypothetical protein